MISNLNNYVIFHTVAKTGNISKAAKPALHQPTSDQQINIQA